MNLQQALDQFGRQPRRQREYDTLAEATVEATRLTHYYPGPYDLVTGIYPLDTGKHLLLATWYDLGS